MRSPVHGFLLLVVSLCLVAGAQAETSSAKTLRIAVSANFRLVAEKLADGFSQETGHKVTLSSGSTGALYNQITYGAPFDIFLSADSLRPRMLAEQGKVAGTAHTYAYGRLVFWLPKVAEPTYKDLSGWTGNLAIANPNTAPYGVAAKQVLEHFGLWNQPQISLVQGSSIQQAWQFVATGNVNAGFVALSQLKDGNVTEGYLLLRDELYNPIRQDAVVIAGSSNSGLGQKFLDYILAPSQQERIQSAGYYRAIDPAVESARAKANTSGENGTVEQRSAENE